MRILLLTPGFGRFGGVARSSARIKTSLEALGHTVDVLSHDPDLFPGQVESEEGVERFGAAPKDVVWTWGERAERSGRARRVDAVIGMYASSAGAAAVTTAASLGVPSLVSVRGNDLDRDLLRADTVGFVELACRSATVVTAVSRDATRRIERLFGRPAHFVTNAVDRGRFRPNPEGAQALRARLGLEPGRPVFGLFGEFKPKRGLDRLHAWTDALLETEVLLIGHVRSSVAGITPPWVRVFAPLESDEELTGAYTLCDAVLQPSWRDGMPNVALEAMACATPVIASNVGGLPDLIEDGATGWVCEDDDAWRRAFTQASAPNPRGENARASVPTPDLEARALLEVLAPSL